LDPTHISERYSIGKILFCRTLEYLTLGEHKYKHKQIKPTRYITVHLCSGCQVTTHLFLVNNLGISALQHSSNQIITPQLLKKKKVWKFFHHYLRPIPLDSSLLPYRIHPYHFSTKISDLACPLFRSPILMAHTHSQELESRFNSLQSSFLKTQQEVKQLSATIASHDTSINTPINTPINASVNEVVLFAMMEVKHEMTTQLEFVFASLCTKLKIPTDDSFPDAHTKTEGETSSHSFQPHHFQWDIHLPQVDVTKFDSSDPTGWVTQMEHYFSLYNITDDLSKLRDGVLHLDQERWQWWKWRKNSCQGYIA
jgi:hypothetical protein